MSIYNLGRVLPIFTGEYDNSKTYNNLDVVLYNGSSYVATNTTQGNLPTDTNHWAIVALAGTLSPEQVEYIQNQVIQYVQGQGYVIDNDYTHTDNNFSDSDKTKLDGIDMTTKQDVLQSGINIKTINGNSILGEGNMEIQTGGGGGTSDYTQLSNKPSINGTTLIGNVTLPTMSDLDNKQDTLVSGTNIATINGNNLLNGGNINIDGSGTPEQKNLVEITLTDYISGYVSSTEKIAATSSGSKTYYIPVLKGERYVGIFTPTSNGLITNNTGAMGYSANIPAVDTKLTTVNFQYSHHNAATHVACVLRSEWIAPENGYLCVYWNPNGLTGNVYKVNEDYHVENYDTWIEETILTKSAHASGNPPTGVTSYTEGYARKSYLIQPNTSYKLIYRTIANQGTDSYTVYDINGNVLTSSNDASASTASEHIMEDIVFDSNAYRIEFYYYLRWNSTDNVLYHGNVDEGMAALMKPLLDDGSMPINDIVYCVSRIKRDQIPYNYNSSTQYDFTEDIWSAWAVRFPSGWQLSKKQTPLFAFLHGTGGFVTSDRLTYATAYGTKMVNLLYDAGIAVFDINGFGVTFKRNEYTKHWGCPAAIATMKKAYTVLTDRFNCRKGMVVGCVSMGGALAKSYAMTYPNDCEACAMCAPSEIGIKLRNDLDEMPFCWGFPQNDPSPNYILGYTPLALPKVIKEITIDGATEKVICQKDTWTGTELKTLEVYCPFPVQTVIWQGTSDTNVPIEYNRAFVKAARNAGSNVKLREIPDYPHNISDYYDEVVGYAKSILKV